MTSLGEDMVRLCIKTKLQDETDFSSSDIVVLDSKALLQRFSEKPEAQLSWSSLIGNIIAMP